MEITTEQFVAKLCSLFDKLPLNMVLTCVQLLTMLIEKENKEQSLNILYWQTEDWDDYKWQVEKMQEFLLQLTDRVAASHFTFDGSEIL